MKLFNQGHLWRVPVRRSGIRFVRCQRTMYDTGHSRKAAAFGELGSEMADQTTTMIAVEGCNIGLMRGGAGQPLVVLHGASGAGTWLPFMHSLADNYDVIVPEHPGFGASDTPDWLDNIHDLAYFYLDILDQLDLDPVHLVGVSLGGWIAAELAVRSTQRLSSLTLVDAAGIHVPGVEQIDTFLRTDEQ